jgi:hypothetical protein
MPLPESERFLLARERFQPAREHPDARPRAEKRSRSSHAHCNSALNRQPAASCGATSTIQ